MLIIYTTNRHPQAPLAPMFFQLNDQEFEFTSDVNRDDINILLFDFYKLPDADLVKNKIILGLVLFHDYNDHAKNLVSDLHNYPDNFYFVTNCIDHTVSHPNILHVDFVFNRAKAYYSQYPFTPGTYRWYHSGLGSYVVPEIKRGIDKSKVFLAPNKTHKNYAARKLKYRKKLVDFLVKNFKDIGFIGNPDDSPEFVLYSQNSAPDLTVLPPDFTAVDPTNYNLGHYSPPHVHYYNESFISIYGESLETGTSVLVTEKTYDPLIKGHFILPFSTRGLIAHLKTMEFKFPTFIDYSYDDIADDDLRFDAYINEVSRLLNLRSDHWPTEYFNNREIINHNRQLFWKRDYNKIDFSAIIKQHKT